MTEVESRRDVIQAIDLSKLFHAPGQAPVRALDSVSLAIGENEFFTLLGPSGCGKTTLLRMIAGFDFPSEGRLLLDGEDIGALPPNRRPINTVFQNYALFPHMTVAENIGFGLEMLDQPKARIAARVAEMLVLVHMEDLAGRRIQALSGGQQQRVALARALAPQPKVLLLDEPLSALDYKLRKEMQIELKRLQTETGITFIFVTHDQEEALTMSDRIAVMSKGRVLQVGTPHDIYDRPANRTVAQFIGETNLLEGKLFAGPNGFGRVELSPGQSLMVQLDQPIVSGTVTAALRPEQARLVDPSTSGALVGVVQDQIYFGTDTHYQIRLQGGAIFAVRRQNAVRGGEGFPPGSPVGVVVEDGAARLLKE